MSINVAVVIESCSTAMPPTKRRQTVMFNLDGKVVIFTRQTDGKQGLGSRWESVADVETLIASLHDNEKITRNVTGVEVTLSDITKYRETERIQVLGVKSVTALNKAELDWNSKALEAIVEWYQKCEDNSPELAGLVIKGTNSTPQQTTQQPIKIKEGESMTSTLNVSLASVPRAEIGERYVNRKLAGDLMDYEVFDYARASRKNVLIYGPTGPGKTTSIEAWCAVRGIRCVIISGNAALEPSQLFGKFIATGDPDVPFQWIDGPLTDAARNGNAVIVLDELNFIPMKIITPTYPMLDARRTLTLLEHKGEVIELHPDVTIFATMNPNYVGTSPLNAAFRNRFDIQIPWNYDYDVESKLVKSKVLVEMAKHLRTEAEKGMYDTPIATNMLMEFEEIALNLNYHFAVDNFIAHFSDEEQSSIRLVFQTYEHNLRDDLGLAEDVVLEHAPESAN